MILASTFALFAAAAPQAQTMSAGFGVEGTRFVIAADDGRRLRSEDLVGAVFEIAGAEGATVAVRIDAVTPAAERSAVLLHTLSIMGADGKWAPMCDADAQGRRAGFPLRGRWVDGRFIADEAAWFLTCTSGSQGKCVLWGYDPWGQGPDGRPLADFYRACQQMVRADYLGDGQPHTRNGTPIDTADIAGIQKHESLKDPAFAFEAGWGPLGAVCVARTRWPDLIAHDDLIRRRPALGGTCDEAEARRRGALMFTRVKAR